jgi:hypothetical protein
VIRVARRRSGATWVTAVALDPFTDEPDGWSKLDIPPPKPF